ncbi:endonuclease/exonuclease/phosphatase family protein [Nocardia sp. NPDC051570]|uniref:endonuclease/exonuclease/phosphatase family protein n=1 Tax=Nocardia sp. NPDC051570 TaxID=3364324 RepID=UPI0037BD61A5
MRAVDVVLLGAAAMVAVLVVGHDWVPDVGGLGVLLDSVAPWLGVGVPVLVLVAVACRSRLGVVAAVVVPLLAWGYAFGGWWAGTGPQAVGAGRLNVVTQNLSAANDDPREAVRVLRATGADLIALQEVSWRNAGAVEEGLSGVYPYHAQEGTVGLWSRYPISGTEPVDVGVGWRRGLRARVDVPGGPLTVHVVHLPSIRLGASGTRDRGLATLSEELTADSDRRGVVLGDFNTTATDRHWEGFAPGYHDTRSAGRGPQFTWPAWFPMLGPDHILARGLRPISSAALAAPGSDHRGLEATLALEP